MTATTPARIEAVRRLRAGHPAAQPILDAITTARTAVTQLDTVDDVAAFAAAIAGDGAGAINAIAELGTLLESLARHPALATLPTAHRRYISEAFGYVAYALHPQGEELIGAAHEVLDNPGLEITGDFYTDHGINLDNEGP